MPQVGQDSLVSAVTALRPDHPNKQTSWLLRQESERAKFNNLALQVRRSKPQDYVYRQRNYMKPTTALARAMVAPTPKSTPPTTVTSQTISRMSSCIELHIGVATPANRQRIIGTDKPCRTLWMCHVRASEMPE
jgi:hypothetical protein